MRNIRPFAAAVLALCLAAPLAAVADEAPGRDLTEIRTQQIQLRAQAEAAEGLFEDMSDPEREQLIARQSRFLDVIDGKQNVNELDDSDQVEAFNLLEAISATIMQAEARQTVCELVQKTGSHRKVKVCMTVAERDQLREESRIVMDKAKNGLKPGWGFGAD